MKFRVFLALTVALAGCATIKENHQPPPKAYVESRPIRIPACAMPKEPIYGLVGKVVKESVIDAAAIATIKNLEARLHECESNIETANRENGYETGADQAP